MMRGLMTAATAAAAILAGHIPAGQVCAPAAPAAEVFVRPCPTEDTFTLCHWDAATRGNKSGRSFLSTAEGFTVILDTLAVCDAEGQPLPCFQAASSDGAWPYVMTADGRTFYLETP